jgi:hypothetical protein
MMPSQTDESIRLRDGSISQNTKVEISERTLSIISFGLSVAAIVLAMWSNYEAQNSARESRLLQQQVMDQSALLLREGIRQPGDANNGPAGNLDYKRKP